MNIYVFASNQFLFVIEVRLQMINKTISTIKNGLKKIIHNYSLPLKSRLINCLNN